MTKHIKIDPDKWYSMSDIVNGKMFPWARSFWSVRNWVSLDERGNKILKVSSAGSGRATKYHFKGENIIKFIKEFESGKVRL